jgi:Sec-independent protein translocase protein TatA
MSEDGWIIAALLLAVAAFVFARRAAIRNLLEDAAQGIRAFRDRL